MAAKTTNLIVGATAVAFVGAALFLFSRPAAAKNKAAKAFVVDPNCGSFLVIDEAEAKSALTAAAIAVAPSPDSSAIAALKAILAHMFPQCDWTDPPDERTFVRGTGQFLRWGDIESAVGDKTIVELKELLSTMGVMQGSPTEPFPWIVSDVFGTGGCVECAMGTGQAKHKEGPWAATPKSPSKTKLPPGIPTEWLPVAVPGYNPQAYGFRRWLVPKTPPPQSAGTAHGKLYLKNGAVSHLVLMEYIYEGGYNWKGRVLDLIGDDAGDPTVPQPDAYELG